MNNFINSSNKKTAKKKHIKTRSSNIYCDKSYKEYYNLYQ